MVTDLEERSCESKESVSLVIFNILKVLKEHIQSVFRSYLLATIWKCLVRIFETLKLKLKTNIILMTYILIPFHYHFCICFIAYILKFKKPHLIFFLCSMLSILTHYLLYNMAMDEKKSVTF